MADLTCKHEWTDPEPDPELPGAETRKCMKCGVYVFRQIPLWLPRPGPGKDEG